MSATEEGLLAEIANHPRDPFPRMVYADYLEDRSDPRAELIRINCELIGLPKKAKKRAELWQREKDLVAQIPDRLWLQTVFIPHIENRKRDPESYHGFHSETIELMNPGGPVAIVTDGFGAGLEINGTPIAYNWDDCAGSIGQFLYQTGRKHDYQEALDQLRSIAEGNLSPEKPLAGQLEPLLYSFRTGRYRLAVLEVDSDYYVQEPPDLDQPRQYEWYPYTWEFIRSQPREMLDEDRIEWWEGQIRNGAQPVIFTASFEETYCSFIIDGHHKLEAYQNLGRPLRIVDCTKLWSKGKQDEVQHFFGKDKRAFKAYDRLRRTHGFPE